jgi:hypothetical protein
MRTFDEDDFDSRTTLPRADKGLILELSDDDFRRGYVGQAPQRHMPRMPPEIPGYVKSRRVWPIFLFITLAAASAGLVLGAGGVGSDWRANAATKFAGSVTITEQSLAQPKKEEPSASAPAPEPTPMVKHMIAEDPAPAPIPAPKPYVPVAPKVAVKPAPKPEVAPPAASVEPKSASDDENVSPPAPAVKASAEPPADEADPPKPAAPKPADSSDEKPEN